MFVELFASLQGLWMILSHSFLKVIHGDIKPENILVRNYDKKVKLIDFGFAHIVKEGEPLHVLGSDLNFSSIL